MPEKVDAQLARTYWLACIENVAQLVDDAVVLYDQSPGRAWSLLILAQEELGKASHLYSLANHAWSTQAASITLTDDFVKMERKHPPKLIESFRYGEELDWFWGDYSRLLDEYETFGTPEFDSAQAAKTVALKAKAEDYNRRKQAGFYVDRAAGTVRRPSDVPTGDFVAEVGTTARIAVMLLITDHSRMKSEVRDLYESTNDLQHRFLPYSHPEDYFAVADRR